MKLNKYANTWNGLKAERIVHRLTTPLALVVTLVALMGWHKDKETVVLVPPQLSEEMQVTWNSADAAYKQAWGLFTAEMMGNVTPGSAPFLVDNLSFIFSSKVYQGIKQSIAEQVDRVVAESLTISYTPQNMMYEIETDKVFITGQTEITGPSGDSVKSRRTYEFIVGVVQGAPQVTYWDVYEGNARTKKIREREARDAERARDRATK